MLHWELSYLHYVVCTMDIKYEIVVVENVGGIDGPLHVKMWP
jgi:hypothetical protein